MSKGHNVDFKNMNWVLFDEFMALPFSYLCFAMLDKVDDDLDFYNNAGHIFDIEAFNYIFNRQTGLMDSSLLDQEEDKLVQVLEFMLKEEPDALNLINYCYDPGKFPENHYEQ